MTLLGGQQKRKDAPESIDQPLAKKAKRSKTAKHIAGQDHDRNSQSVSSGNKKKDEFRTLEAQMTVNIPASYTGPGRPRQAVLEMLDSILMQYVPNLQGVLLAHSNLEFASQTASFLVDSSFAKVDVSFTATVWSPTVGSKLWGIISICSPDHIGLLIHKTFNASIPRHHIPVDEWEFEYGPLENDPEYGIDAEDDGDEPQQEGEDSGRWVHKDTRENIGGASRRLEFTIIGLSIADAMLSLIGSLQADPFSPDHKPQPAFSSFTSGGNRRRSKHSIAEEESVADALMAEDPDSDGVIEPFTRADMASDEDEEGTYDMEGEPLGDAFEQLGRETDQLTRELARDAKKSSRRKEEEEGRKEKDRAEKKERKRKRREERRLGDLDGGETTERPTKKKKKKDGAV